MIVLFFLLSLQSIEAKSDMAQFQLYTKCLGVHLRVEELPNSAERIRLTRNQIVRIVEDKLRAAKLLVPREFTIEQGGDFHPILYVVVNVSRTAFSLGIELRKVVLDNYSEQEEYAVTWRIGVLGVHGFRNQFVLRMVDKYTGVFVDEWTKFNRSYCLEKETTLPKQAPIQPPVRTR